MHFQRRAICSPAVVRTRLQDSKLKSSLGYRVRSCLGKVMAADKHRYDSASVPSTVYTYFPNWIVDIREERTCVFVRVCVCPCVCVSVCLSAVRLKCTCGCSQLPCEFWGLKLGVSYMHSKHFICPAFSTSPNTDFLRIEMTSILHRKHTKRILIVHLKFC